jgi:glycosyltransferase involved in cell wall biosynthesis
MLHGHGTKRKSGKTLPHDKPSICFAYPGELKTATGGYAYARRIMQALVEQGWSVQPLALGDGFPSPTPSTCKQAQSLLMQVPTDHLLVIDGLALGVLPQAAQQLHQLGHPFTALVHHPLAREAGVSPDQAQRLHRSEYDALQFASGVIVTSEETARTVSNDFDIPPHLITVANPGTDRPAPIHVATGNVYETQKSPLRLLSVGALVTRKGFDILIKALAPLTDLNWHLDIVGDDARDLSTSENIKALILHYELQDRIHCTGAVDQSVLLHYFAQADIFVLASHYEGYGMAYAEALAAGLPIIGTTGGAIPHTVPPSAGILVEPGNISALTQVLKQLLSDDLLRQQLKLGAQHCANQLPSWEQSAVIFAQSLLANQNQTTHLAQDHKL